MEMDQKVELVVTKFMRGEYPFPLPESNTAALIALIKTCGDVVVTDDTSYYDENGEYVSKLAVTIDGVEYYVMMHYDAGMVICYPQGN